MPHVPFGHTANFGIFIISLLTFVVLLIEKISRKK
ncbi:putative holin-like toxin [Leuconostoc mesenteroides]|nr:putative holin-like toxin [Leuconostoc mesenteroides]MCM6832614.1 putative holin-like toxin [Leuconostoc mesenteroides]